MWRDGIRSLVEARQFNAVGDWRQYINEAADTASAVKRQYPRTEIASDAIGFEQAAEHVLERLNEGSWGHDPSEEEAGAFSHIEACLRRTASRRLDVSQYPYRMRISREALEHVRAFLDPEIHAGRALVDDRGEAHVVVGCDDSTSAAFARLRDDGFEWIEV